jgi:hypothetical protein
MYQVLPDLPPEEFEALREDIHRRGVQVPVEVTTLSETPISDSGFFLEDGWAECCDGRSDQPDVGPRPTESGGIWEISN